MLRGRIHPRRSLHLAFLRRGKLHGCQHPRVGLRLFATETVARGDVPEGFDVNISSYSDLRGPHLWYPQTRKRRRTIVYHAGPTNSGKTHSALQRLRDASSGVYCGPLRLLAWEVHERLNKEGVPCNLLTGQEVEEMEGARHVACTVEMTELFSELEVAVLDEIQMIGDLDRGWAWTRVLLGADVKELHLCGDESAVGLIQKVVAHTGDALEVKHYKRLSPLLLRKKPIKSLANIKRGDCVVAFSRRYIYLLKKKIEEQTGLKCGVVYGNLPPLSRRAQAQSFNAQTGGTDVLVATDAIGMGLNLSIGRILFSAVEKFDGVNTRPLTVSEVKQIAGRAGRFQSLYPTGTVCGFDSPAIAHLAKAFASDVPPITKAGILPTLSQLEDFAACISPEHLQLMKSGLESDGDMSDYFAFTDSENDDSDSEEELEVLDEEFRQRWRTQETPMNAKDAKDAAPSDNRWRSSDDGSILGGIGMEDLDFDLRGDARDEAQHGNIMAAIHRADHVPGVDVSPPSAAAAPLTATSSTIEFSDAEEESEEEGGGEAEVPWYVKEDPYSSTTRKEEYAEPEGALAFIDSGEAPFSSLLQLFANTCVVDNDTYFLCDFDDLVERALLIDTIPMPLPLRYALCMAPVDTGNPRAVAAFRRYAKLLSVGSQRIVPGVRTPSKIPQTSKGLLDLETCHSVLDLYLWLARKFPENFPFYKVARENATERGIERLGDEFRAYKKHKRAAANSKRSSRGRSRSQRYAENMMQTFGILNGNRQRIQHGRGARGFSTTSKAWVNKYADDHYTRLAQQEGYRSRASYKLMQMNKHYKFLRTTSCVVDLGAAPGGWTQVAVKAARARTARYREVMKAAPSATTELPKESRKGGRGAIGFLSLSAMEVDDILQEDADLQAKSEAIRLQRLSQEGGNASDAAAEAIGTEPVYMGNHAGGCVIGVDLLPIEPIKGAKLIVGDFEDEAVKAKIRNYLRGFRMSRQLSKRAPKHETEAMVRNGEADLVLSDCAPSFSGDAGLDYHRQMLLAWSALEFAGELLHRGGHFVVKVREGPQTKAFKKVVGDMFTQVDAVKPHASRPESAEHYLIGMHFNGAHVKRMSEPLE